MFSDMCKDKVSLVKQNGYVKENIKALVSDGKIFIFDDKLPLEENDTLLRILPNGMFEKYIVLDRGFIANQGGIQGHFQAKVTKEGSIDKNQYRNITIINNISGTQARVNINTEDNSINTMNPENKELFEKLFSKLQEIDNESIKENALAIAKEMQLNINKPTFKEKYQQFISTVANYITIISPFIPALTKLL